MEREQPRGLFARFGHLIRGMFAIWLRRSERQNPAAVYEQAISERTRQYRELKEAVAGILYMRNKLEAEINERRLDIARLHDDIRNAIRRGPGGSSEWASCSIHRQSPERRSGRERLDSACVPSGGSRAARWRRRPTRGR